MLFFLCGTSKNTKSILSFTIHSSYTFLIIKYSWPVNCLAHQTLPSYFTFHGKALKPNNAYQFGKMRLFHYNGILKLKILEIVTMVGFILEFRNEIRHMLWWVGLPNIKVSVSSIDHNKPSIMNWIPFFSMKLIFVSSNKLIF